MVALNDPRRWLPVDAPLRNAADDRSAAHLEAVVEQFDVEHNPRYAPRHDATYCNIFAGDVMAALGAPLPHWVDANGYPAKPGALGAREQPCNALIEWVASRGVDLGWAEVDRQSAQEMANEGKPVLAIWRNVGGGHGHIAVVLPGPPELDGPWMSCAGAKCRARALRADCFPHLTPRYFRFP